ncbi:MAG: 2-amino-4-hydroxy-6-hydroxymethyldihydropteridine diphosphokinase [Candidatus Hydrogenedentes bacterium]|nr:2-amino-4-hydroxy-6-hydroxymethyldihydropteridine diphosphokinase [Candidatus Hydrogenedentota bacterium]
MGVYLSIGSNLGDRQENLLGAVECLEKIPGTRVFVVSSVYETAPIGDIDQPSFLNLAVGIETALTPLELLDATQDIERLMGRVPSRRWGPRLVDIDIVLWDDRVMDTDRLRIPHPEFRKRAFVLRPLTEIAPETVDPVTGRTVVQLAASPEAQGEVRRLKSDAATR